MAKRPLRAPKGPKTEEEVKEALARGVPPGIADADQCTHINGRTGLRCKQASVSGSSIQKCRFHGGAALMGANHPGFRTGRHSKYLPNHLKELYDEAATNPNILEMADHLALLESRINDQLRSMQEGEIVPRWSNFKETFDLLATSILAGNPEEINAQLGAIFAMLNEGDRWDRAWDNILESMEQLRKVADVEIKRRRELHLMIPVEKVIVLMAAVSNAVKRHVSNPHEIVRIQAELEAIYVGDKTAGGKDRMEPGEVDYATRKNQKLVRSGALDAEIVGRG